MSQRAGGSIARNSLFKLVSNASRMLLGLVTGVLTARWLGPYDKGTLSTLLFAGHVVLFNVCSLGLGEALAVLVGRKRTTLQESLATSLGILAPACAIGIASLWVVATLADWGGIQGAVVLTGFGLVLWVYLNFFINVLSIEERFFMSSVVTTLSVAATAFSTWALVGSSEGSITRAVLAVDIGLVVGLIAVIVVVSRSGIRLRPRWDAMIARSTLKLGVGLQLAYLLIVLAQRADQLAVYALGGPSSGGQYSVALTVGQLAAFIPSALSAATFPRISHLDPDEASRFIERLTRTGIVMSLIIGIGLCLMIPLAIPMLWGAEYEPSVIPAEILVVGGMVWSAEWILARAAAARGRSGVVLATFSANLVVMLIGDLLFIERFGLKGAALSSLGGSLVGLLIVLMIYRRDGYKLSAFLPGPADLRQLMTSTRTIWAST